MMFSLRFKLNWEVIHYWNDRLDGLPLEISGDVMKNRDNSFARKENKTGVSNNTNINNIDESKDTVVKKMAITEIVEIQNAKTNAAYQDMWMNLSKKIIFDF